MLEYLLPSQLGSRTDSSDRSSAVIAEVHDVIVVGSGLTGGWAAKQLANAGLDVLVLEAGPALAPEVVSDLKMWTRERRDDSARRQPIQSRHFSYWTHNPTLFVDDFDNPYSTADSKPFTWIRGRQVGGRSLTWGGVTLRFSDWEFRASSLDGHGAAWPFGYEDLAPYYDKVERLFGVKGSYEGLEQLPDGIFQPPSPMTETELRFRYAVRKQWDERRVIHCRGVPDDGTTCPDAGPGWGRRTSLHALLSSAIATGCARLMPNAIVSRLILSRDGRNVQGVACVHRETGKPFQVYARVVALCASTIESVRIMLNSRSPQHPDGAGNASGLLGCFLMDHAATSIGGTIPGSADLEAHPPATASHGILIPRFRNVRQSRKDFIRGYGIWGGMQRGNRSANADARWFLSAITEVLPRVENRVRLDDRLVDKWGIRAARIELSYSENELRLLSDAEQCMRDMARAAGLSVDTSAAAVPGGYVHELGGARMGIDPANSILNPFNQCWTLRNLFVLDGSCFVTSGWQNPTLTMMALAVRACDYIAREFRRGGV
jgi:choline dehydrogenase-like flavoprotein